MNTPVAFIIFNRPERTARVFAEIRTAKPKQLFVIADGPRTTEEAVVCAQTRAITEAIDWECDVKRYYMEKNVGIRKQPPQGISWVFSQVDRAIILEDDCVPHPSFFPYCEELLERYKDDTRIMQISGDNFHQENSDFKLTDSYYFSVVPQVWGWATWKRAWDLYDLDFPLWPKAFEQHWLKNVFADPATLDRWEYVLDRYYKGTAPTWDGAWAFACFINNGLSINPRVNLVSNIGFGATATTSKTPHREIAELPTQELAFPLVHPQYVVPHREYDAYIFRHIFYVNKRFKQRALWFFKSHFPGPYRFAQKLLRR